MNSQHPRSDGPRRRRAFTASEKLDLPDTVWINRLADDTDQQTDTDAAYHPLVSFTLTNSGRAEYVPKFSGTKCLTCQ